MCSGLAPPRQGCSKLLGTLLLRVLPRNYTARYPRTHRPRTIPPNAQQNRNGEASGHVLTRSAPGRTHLLFLRLVTWEAQISSIDSVNRASFIRAMAFWENRGNLVLPTRISLKHSSSPRIPK